MVDVFSTIEQTRLLWSRTYQTILRNELYTHITDSVWKGDANSSNVDKGVIFPAIYVGSKHYMQQNFQDALAACCHVGHPDIFLTMTCNSMWDEIQMMMVFVPGCIPANCPDIISRLFRLKLEQFDDIKKKAYFGRCMGGNESFFMEKSLYFVLNIHLLSILFILYDREFFIFELIPHIKILIV